MAGMDCGFRGIAKKSFLRAVLLPGPVLVVMQNRPSAGPRTTAFPLTKCPVESIHYHAGRCG